MQKLNGLAAKAVVAHPRHKGRLSAQSAHGHSLIGSLAALVRHKVVSHDGLAGRRQMLHPNDHIGIRTADDNDGLVQFVIHNSQFIIIGRGNVCLQPNRFKRYLSLLLSITA